MAQNERLELDLLRYEKLNSLQAGHLRHFHNLVAQPDANGITWVVKKLNRSFLTPSDTNSPRWPMPPAWHTITGCPPPEASSSPSSGG